MRRDSDDDRPRPEAVAEPASPHAPLSFGQFVAMVASLMALNALAIDIMLPALPDIGAAFRLTDPNEAQTVVTAYLVGFGVGQLATGVLADRFGRRKVLIGGLLVYGFAALLCLAAPSMALLLAGRALQGLGSAAPRVVAIAIVRDCYGGRSMARVMSLAMMIFMAVPVLAPSVGQLVLLFASWHVIFALLAAYAFLMLWISFRRLPETLKPEYRREIRIERLRDAAIRIFGSRQTVGYMLSAGAFFGALVGFINSAQQVLGEVLGLGEFFPLVFAVVAGGIACSSFLNSRLVEGLGMRRLSHGATLVFLCVAATMFVLASLDLLGLATFLPLLLVCMLLVGVIFPNFNALAIEPQQEMAGIASSIVGAATVLVGAPFGYLVGQAFDGTMRPLAMGFVISAAATLTILLVTERGRLMQPVSGR